MKRFEKSDGSYADHAYINGYHFGDKLLEGVYFKVTIDKEDNLKVEVVEEALPYFNQLNKELWLGHALSFAEENDVFAENEDGCGDELFLVEIE